MMPILAIAVKDLKMIARDRAAAFFTFVFPMLLAVFFGFVFQGGGGGGELDLGVVDEDRSAESASFVADLKKADGLKVVELGARDQGTEKVRRGELSATIVLPKGFGQGAGGMFGGEGMKIEGFAAPGSGPQTGLLTGKLMELGFRQMIGTFGKPEKMTAQLDRARRSVAESSELSPERKATFLSFFGSLDTFSHTIDAQEKGSDGGQKKIADGVPAEEKDDSPLANWKPIDVSFSEIKRNGQAPRSSFEISFPQGVVWGLMGCTLAFGISLAEERTRGTLMRLTTSPLSRSHILMGKAVGCFISCALVQTVLLVMAVLPPFRVQITSLPAMAASVVLCSVGFTGVMMLLAGLSKTEAAAQGVGRAVMLVLALIGGGSVPLFILPKTVQMMSGVSPFRWATLLIEGSLWREFTFADMVLPGGIMLGIGVAGYAIGSASFRWRE